MHYLFNFNYLSAIVVMVLVSYAIGINLVPIVIRKVIQLNMMDEPDHRKLHAVPTPSMGGLAIIASIYLTIIVPVFYMSFQEAAFILVALISFALLGFFDDWKDLNAKFKLFVQLAFASAAYFLGFKIDHAFGLFGVEEIAPIASYILTVGLYILLINAYNLIDGIDGLAGGILVINLCFFIIIFLMFDHYGFALLSAITLGAVFGFLKYNFHPAKIFMGDSGSLPLGMLMAVFTFESLALVPRSYEEIHSHIWLIPALVAVNSIPFFDTLRVFIVRIMKGKSPFNADRIHLHHIFQKNNFGHTQISLFIHASHLIIIMFAIICTQWTTITVDVFSVVAFSAIAFEMNTFLRIREKTKQKSLLKEELEQFNKKNRFLHSLKK